MKSENPRHVKLFSGKTSKYLAEQIAVAFGAPLGAARVSRFSDGEFSPYFEESVRGCDVFIIQSTFAPTDNLFELLLLVDAAKRASAHYITAVIPYFGFARSDRKDKPRVAIASKLVANLLTAAGVTRIMTMDLHAPQIQGFFDVPVDHLDATAIFVPYIQHLNLPNLLIAAPDMGGVHRAREYAKFFNAEMAIIDKHRKRANEIESMQIIGDVAGKDVILVDDIIDTAGTITKAAALLKKHGAASVRAFCTHPVLSGQAYERLDISPLEEVVVCDTIPLKQESAKIKVLPTASLFAKAIRRVYTYESISTLFIKT
ncbi:MAG: ribose-phosphate pyrophosphokinase [Bacteroidia bacterium]|nr:ribose-phosphate pyrophosphokinase [Bacteroidia bacterium]MCZ2276465.1 ribose-phosphate pyrophosphokinase [Bacteroidia bacterium]